MKTFQKYYEKIWDESEQNYGRYSGLSDHASYVTQRELVVRMEKAAAANALDPFKHM